MLRSIWIRDSFGVGTCTSKLSASACTCVSGRRTGQGLGDKTDDGLPTGLGRFNLMTGHQTSVQQRDRLSTGTMLRIMQCLAVACILSLALGLYHPALAVPTNGQSQPEFDTLDAAAKRNLVQHAGFVFDFFTGNRNDPSPNGFAVPGNVDTDAFLSTLDGAGASVNLLSLGPCAGNTPHMHPRGTEVSTVLRGNLQFGYVEENAGQNRLVAIDAKPGQVVFIPQGLMHFAHNLECAPASFVANFGNRDPGVQTVWSSLMQIPTPLLAASLNIDDLQERSEAIIEGWKRRQLVASPATGGAECLARCYISYQQANNFSAPPIQKFNPIVPADQKGNHQSFRYGRVNANAANRCDFVGLTQLPPVPGPNQCAGAGYNQYNPGYTTGHYRRLNEVAQKIKDQMPLDKITVMDAAQVLEHDA